MQKQSPEMRVMSNALSQLMSEKLGLMMQIERQNDRIAELEAAAAPKEDPGGRS